MKKQKEKNNLSIYVAVLVSLILVLIPLLVTVEKTETGKELAQKTTKQTENIKENNQDNQEENTTEKETEEPTTIDNNLYEVSLIAVGDNLISDSVTHCGLQSDGSYDFSELYGNLKPEIEKADLAVINQETILGGPDFEYTGYPCFNSPYEIGDAVIAAGFDLVLQASNHSYDMGVKGIENCMAYWKKHPEITMIGLNKSKKQQKKITVIEKNHIKFAVLNYTYGLNGFKLPEGKEYLVNFLEEEKIKSDIQQAEELADFTIVFPHWGIEYSFEPDGEQKQLAKKMTEWGADLILGAHPHVLEPIEWIEAENGNKALCYYSLGNYTSSQDKTATMLGGMAKLTIAKQGNDIHIKDGAGVLPIVTHYIWGQGRLTKTFKLTDYTEELARVHSINTVTDDFSLQNLKQIAQDVVGDWIVK